MGDVAKRGRTVVMVSHNMSAIQNLCNRVIWLNEGKIAAEGKPATVVTQYLGSSFSSRKQQQWNEQDAPGNEKARIHSIALIPESETEDSVITMTTPLRIAIEFENRLPGEHLDITLLFFTDQEVIAFSTSSVNDPSWRGRPLDAAKYRMACQIPANLLNNGLYRISLLAVKDESTVLFRLDDALSFEVFDYSERRGWFGKRPGAVRPVLPWTTEQL